MLGPEEAKSRFLTLAAGSTDEIDLVEASLLIAATLGSEVDTEEADARLARLARRAVEVMHWAGDTAPENDPAAAIVALNRVLFVEAQFRGNEENYSDPENSFLNMVLERRTGLPITLSIVYMEVARRAGLELRGVGLPGHFVVGYFAPGESSAPSIVVDAFNGGQLLSLKECREIATGMTGSTEPVERWLSPATSRSILWRLLNNLKQVYLANDSLSELGLVVDLMLALDPGAGSELKDRAFLSYRSGRFDQAHEDMTRYLDAMPEGDERSRLNYYRRLFERLSVSRN